MSAIHYAWTPNRREVYVPDKTIKIDKPSYYALPMRGASHTCAVWDSESRRFVGWVDIEDLGFKTAKEFMESPKYHKAELRQFIDPRSDENDWL
jgi:hypothetical protein